LQRTARVDRIASMNDFERITRVLQRHLSPIHARSVVRHALSEHRLQATDFKLTDLAKIHESIQRGLRLFTTEAAAARAMQDIAGLREHKPVAFESCTVEINAELDISTARNAARRICEEVGAGGFVIQKVTTIVSELARNIVSYSHGGKVELTWRAAPKPRIVIRAVDRGPGIPNLALVLSGAYQSKTGLGRGLTGTRRLANHFDVTTGEAGTSVLAEVQL
jgi:serine/threonine-protein kinase RsbT